ncbi:MAG: 4Fe-4S dicluster domain-containing protein [Vulcanimicrobiaceae bacterium]
MDEMVRMANGFFTDTTLCIGCKACEVACKQWNELPSDGFEFSGNSYDNTRELSGTTWRHVSFVENMDAHKPSWAMMSDVCKHCTHAGCLEACPTGAIIRNEFGNVYIQPDICNGCGYCVPSCPFGVVDLIEALASPRQAEHAYNTDSLNHERMGQTALQATGGVAGKCTLCYDRQKMGLVPARTKACPTDSIQFGDVEELQARAKQRVADLQERGVGSYLYGVDTDTSVGDLNTFFLLTEKPEAYNLPPRPVLPSTHQPAGYLTAAIAAAAFTVLGLAIFRNA